VTPILYPRTIDPTVLDGDRNGDGADVRPHAGYFNDAMHVIGHHDMRVQHNVWKMCRNFQPTIVGDLPCIIQYHFFIYNIAKQTCPLLATMVMKYIPFCA
jgi:hypothetical protein